MLDDLAAPCADCGADTFEDNHEYYMISDDLWQTAGADEGFLCIGCLETRLGRQLIYAAEYGAMTVDWIIHQMAGHHINHRLQLERVP
jgi:hypothetical protein